MTPSTFTHILERQMGVTSHFDAKIILDNRVTRFIYTLNTKLHLFRRRNIELSSGMEMGSIRDKPAYSLDP
ncbi:hypothetical protein CapIbe_018142 [Capra ibex]